MQIPKYWGKGVQSAQTAEGRTVSFSCWRWSDVSVEDAKQRANAQAATVVHKLVKGQELNHYGYGDRPMREEIKERVVDQAQRELAVITRNAYGSLVLNTARAMFIDIDFPSQGVWETLTAQIRGLFGKAMAGPEERACQNVREWGKQHPDLGIRIYRTFAGLRCLITNMPLEPRHADSMNILRALRSDPLYIRLCEAQACFRARLTPKPWRCGLRKPPALYPWESAELEAQYRRWEQEYTEVVSRYATCRLIGQIGPAAMHPEIKPILDLHDGMACSEKNQNLA